MANTKTPQKESSPKAAKPATEGKGGASSKRGANQGEKKTSK